MTDWSTLWPVYLQSIGQTLDINNISIEEARKGEVARKSIIPDNAPAPAPKK